MHYNGIDASITRFCPDNLKVHSKNSFPPRQILGYVNVTAVSLDQHVQRSWGRRGCHVEELKSNVAGVQISLVHIETNFL